MKTLSLWKGEDGKRTFLEAHKHRNGTKSFLSFLLHRVNPEEVNSMGLRVRVYGCERMRRERLIGETIISFATIDLELETNLWLPLEPRNSSVVSLLI